MINNSMWFYGATAWWNGNFDGNFRVHNWGTGSSLDQPGEPDNSRWNDTLHQRLKDAGVTHRYCRGEGTHDWENWVPEVQDFLAYVYGTTPSTCTTNPGWGQVPSPRVVTS